MWAGAAGCARNVFVAVVPSMKVEVECCSPDEVRGRCSAGLPVAERVEVEAGVTAPAPPPGDETARRLAATPIGGTPMKGGRVDMVVDVAEIWRCGDAVGGCGGGIIRMAAAIAVLGAQAVVAAVAAEVRVRGAREPAIGGC